MKILEQYFDGVIFDMDGLILDNGSLYKKAYQNAAKKLGYLLSDELYEQLIGLSHAACDRILKENFGEGFSVESFTQAMHQEYQESMSKDGVKFRDGFEPLFLFLKKQGLSIGLATSSTAKHVENHLSKTSYLEAFDVICTADDIQRAKPDPEIYHLATSRMNRQVENVLVFEDSNNGMRAAIASGCISIMVPNQSPPEDDVKENAFLVMSSLGDVIPLIC